MFHEIIHNAEIFVFSFVRTLCFFVIAILVISVQILLAQSAQPTPTSGADANAGDYKVTSSIELGVRGLDVNGNENKFRSDLNYKSGFRVFNSSLLIENKSGRDKFFDTFVVNTSGFGADPMGFARFSLEKTGMYRLDGNVRRVVYFNNLANIARNQHTRNTEHYLGDFDFTAHPIADKLQVTIGASFDRNKGPGIWTIRFGGDEFGVDSENSNRARDLRAGISGELGGFNLSLSHGYRRFKDELNYSITSLNVGLNPTNTVVVTGFSRQMPVKGNSNYTMFNAHRTFAKKADFTARVIYSTVDTFSQVLERLTGVDSNTSPAPPRPIVDLDNFEISGDAKRIQTRGDFGLTVFATEKFKISDTFSFDRFGIDGGESFFESLFRRNAAGTATANTITSSTAYRVTDYRRYTNTLEGDYQFNNKVAFHIGYRYSHRRVDLEVLDRTLTSAPSSTNPDIRSESETNQTHTGIAGMKIVPTKNWVVFWDVEHGQADNAFTRLANHKFTNLRVRSRWSFKKFSINLSGITKDNENPSISTAPQGAAPVSEFVSNIKNRIFSGSVDWTPIPELNFGGGYTYQHLTSDTNIVINVGGLRLGTSKYYMRDHHAFLNVSAQPSKRVSIYANYSFNQDLGQGDRLAAEPQFIVSSYPFKSHSPEAKVTFRLARNIDWNIGYQYYRYNEDILNTMPLRFPPFTVQPPPLLVTDTPGNQNYRAHLPYTSLRIYFGGGDR